MADYFVKSGTGGADTGASWADAAESIPGLMTAQAIAGGDTIYVHNTHNFNAGAAITWTLPESGTGLVRVICVDGGDATGASLVGTTVGAITSGARETTGGNFAVTVNTASSAAASLFVHGITIEAGAGASSSGADISINLNSGYIAMSACTIFVNSTNTGAVLSLSGSGVIASFRAEDCTFKTLNTTAFNIRSAIELLNCDIPSGSAPTTAFLFSSGSRPVILTAYGCDFAACTNVLDVSSSTAPGIARFTSCVIGTPTTGAWAGGIGNQSIAEFQACAAADGANGADLLSYYLECAAGVVEDDQTVYKATGGAQGEQDDGTDTSYSLKMTPSTLCVQTAPLYTPWVNVFVSSTGAKTVAMKVAHTEAAALTTSEIWMEVQYMGEPGATGTQRVANSPHAVIEVDDACPVQASTIFRNVISAGTARTDDALDDWTGITSEREHTLTASVTCDEVGFIRCRVGLGKDTTNPVYVDPKISVT